MQTGNLLEPISDSATPLFLQELCKANFEQPPKGSLGFPCLVGIPAPVFLMTVKRCDTLSKSIQKNTIAALKFLSPTTTSVQRACKP